MRITFLGTGTSSGVPMIGCRCATCASADSRDKRLRASVLVETGAEHLLIDAGPDFRQQMLSCGATCLDAILITHEHKDHVGGLDDVRAFNFLNHKPIDIYAEPRVQQVLRKDYDYAFAATSYPGAPQMNLHTIDGTPFSVGDTRIVPVRAQHYFLPVYGYRIGSFGYLTDASQITRDQLEKFFGVEVFVLSTVQRAPHRSHFTLDQAVETARAVGAKQTYLTHLSHCLEPHAALAAVLPSGIEPAYDGLVLDI